MRCYSIPVLPMIVRAFICPKLRQVLVAIPLAFFTGNVFFFDGLIYGFLDIDHLRSKAVR